MLPTASDPVATFVFFMIVFTVIGAFFLFIHLVIGSLVRPYKPDAEKLTIYECGEPTVGSAWVQFDLRYYVVALLFVIFDVEVAFFFPWATVFGTANQLSHLQEAPKGKAFSDFSKAEKDDAKKREILSAELMPAGMSERTKEKLGLIKVEVSKDDKGNTKYTRSVAPIKPETAHGWAVVAFTDILVFFGVLLVGFAYVWRRGDINWVRTYAHHEEPPIEPEKPLEQPAHASPPTPVASHH